MNEKNTNFSKKLHIKVFQPVVFLIGIQHEFCIIKMIHKNSKGNDATTDDN